MTELVRERLRGIVTRAFDRYGYFPVDDERAKFFQICLDLVINICDLVDEKQVPNAKFLKDDIIKSLYALGFNIGLIRDVIGYVFNEIEVVGGGVAILAYEELVLAAVSDYTSLFRVEIVEYLAGLKEYSASDLITRPNGKDIFPVKKRFEGSRLTTRFADIFNSQVELKSDNVVLASFDVNNITSDSKVSDFSLPEDIDTDLLTATFHGGGKKLYDDISRLFNLSAEFGGYQGSVAGSAEYQSDYYSYLNAMCYGRRSDKLGEEFGKFGEIFRLRVVKGKEIPGLKFLEPLYRGKKGSGNNPIAIKYQEGITDRYQSNNTEYVSLVLESVYFRSLVVGDKVPRDGSLQMDMLSKVFPPSLDLEIRSSGLTGGLYKLLTSYNSLGSDKISVSPLQKIFSQLKSSIDSLTDSFKSIGFKPGGYVPSLELNYHEPRKGVIRGRLKSLGFTEPEIDEIMTASNFSELLERLAPMTDSDDVISFFRAFDITKLIYEFGGQNAIDQYIEFLYGRDPDQSLIRLLGYLDVNRTQRSVISEGKYPKLIGYLVMLTYAVNPAQLQVFNGFLRRNNLDLLRSVSLLFENNEPGGVLLRPSQVSLLSGMVAQMVVNDNSGYEYQKPIWNKLIERSAGNVGTGVSGLYLDREGITPTELYQLLNNPGASSPLGEMLNGVRGGRLTSVLRYCNLFGLLYSLSDYRNSYQLMNRKAEEYGQVLELITALDQLSQALDLSVLVLGDAPAKAADFNDPVIQAQSRVFDAFIDIMNGASGSTRGTAEPPGIGNSRIPNGVRIDNSLTPEEARVVISVTSGQSSPAVNYPDETGSYIRVAVSNLLAQGVVVGGEERKGRGDSVDLTDDKDEVTYNVYNRPRTILRASSKYDPVATCKKFGGVDCDELGVGRCSDTAGYNKSLYPETGYGTDATSPGIKIDRPLGEALVKVSKVEKLANDSVTYYYSQQGITELSRTPVLKDSEMLCGSIKDPFEYSACISMLKCKKFTGNSYLPFCPRTLHGGRLAP